MTTGVTETPVAQGYARSLDGKRVITLEEFDRLADEGSDEIDDFIDWSKATRPGMEVRRVHFEWPAWMFDALDRCAEREGVAPGELVQRWVTEKLEATKPSTVPS